MIKSLRGARKEMRLYGYLGFNFLILSVIHKLSDLPIRLGNWQIKAEAFSHLNIPKDNFYPPGSSLLLVPFLWSGPEYFLAIVFYFLAASAIYFSICENLIKSPKLRVICLLALSFNPYLLWLVETSQDTVFELFLLLPVAALWLRKNFWIFLLPLYLLCLTRPSYWALLIFIPILIRLINRNVFDTKLKKLFAIAPSIALISTLGLNSIVFGSSALAGESGLTAHFAHNKYYYLSMPKFDMDVFLSKGGNMDSDKVIQNSSRFAFVEDRELRAAQIGRAHV